MNISVISANTAGSQSSARACLFARSQTTAVTSQRRAPDSVTESLRLARALGLSMTGSGPGATEGTTAMGAAGGTGADAICGGRERLSSRYAANQALNQM